MENFDEFNFKDKQALVRVDFNVPLDKNTYSITDDTRIRATIPTLTKIINDGGSIVLMSHLGRPQKKLKDDGSIDVKKFTLKHCVNSISELMNMEIKFADDCIGKQAFEFSDSLKPGEILLLENLRFYKEEEKGDENFAEKLSQHGNVYVNDAFGTAHRAHASTAVIAKFFPKAKMFGYVMADEIKNAEKVMYHAEKPFTAIIGGAKVSDKILLIEQLMKKVDCLLIGGGMAYTFLKAKGYNIGSSLIEEDKIELAKHIMEKVKDLNVQLHLPQDALIADSFSNEAQTAISEDNDIKEGWMALDIGPKTIKLYGEVIKKSKTILWNGPMGVFEMPRFSNGTRAVASAIAAVTSHGAFSLIGGGDSAAAVNQFDMANEMSYISTGGGALLEYFEGRQLPGIKMIMESE